MEKEFTEEQIKEAKKLIKGKKYCYSCGTYYPLRSSFFHRDSQNTDGHKADCRDCRNKYGVRWMRDNTIEIPDPCMYEDYGWVRKVYVEKEG